MWKKFSCFIALFVSIFAVALSTVKAGNEITIEPYDTWIVGLDGDMVVSSMAYEGINVMNVGFEAPQDIFIDDNDFVYVADSKNKVVIWIKCLNNNYYFLRYYPLVCFPVLPHCCWIMFPQPILKLTAILFGQIVLNLEGCSMACSLHR